MSDNQVKTNIIFNVIKTLMSIIYPLVTFVYVARVLSVEGMGQVNFVKNFASYFCLVASLGISYYGIREGARIAKDKYQFSKFFWEIFYINISTTILSLLAYVIVSLFTPHLVNYKSLLVVNAVSILLSGLSLEWVLASIEKFKYIALRSMFIQLLCIVAMFLFIQDEDDNIPYAILLIVSGYGITLFNWLYIARHQLIDRIKLSELSIKQHFKPVLLLFAMLVSIDLYTLLDTTMLGFIKGDYSVGIYSAAIKIPRLVNSMIAAVGVVLVPRLSYYYDVDKGKFYEYVHNVMNFVFMISIPCFIFLLGMSEEIILLVCGEKYADASLTLRLLAPLTLVIPISVLFNNQIFIPMRREYYVFQATCVGAIVNILFNILLINDYGANGAALASVLAELGVMSICLFRVRKGLQISNMANEYFRYILLSMPMIVPIVITKYSIDNLYFRLITCAVLCVIIFFFVNMKIIMHFVFNKKNNLSQL